VDRGWPHLARRFSTTREFCVGFRDDIEFLIGALNHGMTAEQALPMYQSALQNKQANKQARRDALTNLLTTGQELAGTVTDPQSFTQLMQMYGKGFGARPGQVEKVTDALSSMSDPAVWTPDDTAALLQNEAHAVANIATAGYTAQDIRKYLRDVVQSDIPEYKDPAVWAVVAPQFDEAVGRALMGATDQKVPGTPEFLKNAALRSQGVVASPEEAENRFVTEQPPPAAEGAGNTDSVGWGDLGALAGTGAAISARPAMPRVSARVSKLPGILGTTKGTKAGPGVPRFSTPGKLRSVADAIGNIGANPSLEPRAGLSGIISRLSGKSGIAGASVAPAAMALSILDRFDPRLSKEILGQTFGGGLEELSRINSWDDFGGPRWAPGRAPMA
jgi:hypothetical protein